MSNGYFTVVNECENVIIIERSKFICAIKGVADEKEAKEFVEIVRKKHSLANHNCYAYIADDRGLVQKFSDDGEPQGTAGLPMLEVLKAKKIYKTVAVVTRYFGGVKLGTGGLTRAYSSSVSECLNIAKIADMQQASVFETKIDYEGYSRLLKLISTDGIVTLETSFDNSVIVKFAVKMMMVDGFVKKLTDAFNGKINLNEIGRGYYNFK